MTDIAWLVLVNGAVFIGAMLAGAYIVRKAMRR